MRFINNLKSNHIFINLLATILAIIAGLLFGFIILFISNPEYAFTAFFTIIRGCLFSDISSFSRFIYFATPIIMTGLSVGFAFKTGLFNIGASGQFTLGAYIAIFIGVKWDFLPSSVHWLVAIIFAGIAGALWACIPAILKAFFNVNEVISSIMANYICMSLVNLLVTQNIYNSSKNQSLEVLSTAVIPSLGIPNSNINYSVFIVLFCVIFSYIILNKTTLGFELKACGQNPNAVLYAGINSKKAILLSFIISGAFAGIGGALAYLYGTGKFLQVIDAISPEGFNGIAVALFGQSNPFGILLAGLFIANLELGGSSLQLYGYSQEIIDIIISAIIYFGAFSLLIKDNIISYINKSKN
ncbi:MAG: ABC transporter permease [bacterium]